MTDEARDPATPHAESDPSLEAGARAAKNTIAGAAGEIVGRLASLVLFAAVGRTVGEDGLGAFVFAVAYLQIVMVPVDLGFDRYMTREVARDRTNLDRMFFAILSLKGLLAVPILGISMLGLHLLGYGMEIQLTTLALTVGVFSDSVSRTLASVFNAHEVVPPAAVSLVVQRVAAAALGLAALQAGFEVIGVAVTYTLGSLAGLCVGVVLFVRRIGLPRRDFARGSWRALSAKSIPFAVQDIFTVVLFKVDAVILSLIATQSAVGIYGAAYRVFESTLFISYALAGAFSAMYTYLDHDSEPTVGTVFARSIKLAVVVLTPTAIIFGVLARPLMEAIYGADFGAAAAPLELLAPTVLLIGVVILAGALVVSRSDPKSMIRITAVMALLNIGLNFALIPSQGAAGAAGAMLVTEAAFAVVVVRMALAAGGELGLVRTLAGALIAAVPMAAVALLLHEAFVPALAASTAVYVVVLIAAERAISPADLRFAVSMLRERLRSR
ncbi:MAG: oligosaccharide flippase family protein [Solirubrobacteraceae bacterium]